MIGMAEEEQKQRCFNNRFGSFGTIGVGGVSGRSSSRKLKPKPKRVPQRGLGVAQLEKIRLEEQQKNDAAAVAIFSSSSPSPLSPTTKSSSYLSLPIPGFRQSNRSSSSSSLSFPSPPPVNLSSPTSAMFGPPLPVLNMAVKDSFTVPLVDQANSGGSETGLSAVTILEQGNALKWQSSCEYYLEKENYGVDPGFAFRSKFDLPYEVNPGGWPSPELLQRAQQNQAPSPMVNVSSTTSLSSGLNVQIEPPSNQSYCYGNYSTIWADKEEKMVGMKRLSLFPPNNPTKPTFDYNHPSFTVPNRSNGSTSQGNGSAPSFREDRALSLTCICAPSSLENNKEDDFNGNFLTLASLASSNNVKCPPTYPLLQNLVCPDSEPLHFQGGTRPVGLTRKQPFYSFLPPAEAKSGKETATFMNKCSGEVGERVDLDLKL